jgi:hypothetical protein
MDIKGKFVEARLKDSDEYRQDWVIKTDPLVIRGISTKEYECEGNPVLITHPLYAGKECPRT